MNYRLFPELPADDYELLKQSISEHGVEVPIVVDQDGNVLDGHARQRACDELGIHCPREVRRFDAETDRLGLILRLNGQRRQLDRQQRREVIAAYLRRDPEIADNHLAELIGGISKNTVAEVRAELEATCQIDKLTRLRGKDGKSRPKRYSRIIANSDSEGHKALTLIGSLPENGGKILDTKTASRKSSKEKTRRRLEANPVVPLPDEAVRIYHSRFQDLEAVAGIEPDTVDLILTDIPYGGHFLPEVAELGAMANRILKPGGLLVTYSGQLYLDKVVASLSEHLVWGWLGISVWSGNATLCHPRNVKSKCSPILVYSKGDWLERGQWVDVLQTDSKEKDRHDWQKPIAEIERLLSYFSQPGDLVVDPCGGGFTTAIACDRLGRRCISCDCVEEHVVRGQTALSDDRRLRSGGNRAFTSVPGSMTVNWTGRGRALTSFPGEELEVGA